jgi:hypothetical protein
MTFAPLFLALLTAAGTPSSDTPREPVLLDFHADWCSPCRKMRPVVAELIRQGYPVKSIDIDQAPQLAKRYQVEVVPTFIVIDASGQELARTTGPRPTDGLARFFNTAVGKAHPPANSNAHVGPRNDSRTGSSDDDDAIEAAPKAVRDNDDDRPEQEPSQHEPVFTNPKPWETVARIRVLNARSIGFGSGTIIHSTPKESLVLTCAHIFKLERGRQAPPDRFPRRIKVDLFDGNLQGRQPARVHYLESVDGEAVDYDFTRDVGLIRIRPGRRLPASRVVPAHWTPQSRMWMLTLGCPEGQDATAWPTVIKNPRMKGFLSGNATYEAMECKTAPKQGRSGGGIFTEDGYLAGVCNFAEPQGDHGLYATPGSIYSLLDRNNLMALYAPVTRGSSTLLADGRAPRERHGATPAPFARSQSPDYEEPGEGPAANGKADVMIPPPNLLGIASPLTVQAERSPQAASGTMRRAAWQPSHSASATRNMARPERAEQTDLTLEPSADPDRFSAPAAEPQASGDDSSRAISGPESKSAPVAASPAKTRWKAIKAVHGDQAPAADQASGVP